MNNPAIIFDRHAVRRQRGRAAAGYPDFNFLKVEIAERMGERLDDLRRDFATILDLGAHRGELAALLRQRPGTETVFQADLSEAMAIAGAVSGPALVADEEALPFAEGSLDAILSCLSLHWVNDLPGALVQARRALRPDGLFMGSMLGGSTLTELREVLMQAEIDVSGGLGPRVSPFADLADAASLMQRAGFALPVVDGDVITATYDNALALMRDLRGMGEVNAILERQRGFTPRRVLLRAVELYQERFADADGRIPATFQILYLTGWAPDASQQKPLRPGSATERLATALNVAEVSTGEKPGG